MNDELLVNRAQCLKCGDILVSKHRHDFVSCSCGNAAIDGGTSYCRSIVKDTDNFKRMNLYTCSPWKEVRELVYRGSRGKNGDQPLNWVPLSGISNDYLESLIKYKEDYNETTDVHYWAYKQEKGYRYNQNILILE